MKKKPNIILIQADQMAIFALQSYTAGAQAITPHLDSLAERGVVFENAYSPSPLCCPSRASMFSGSRTSKNEVWGNGSEFRSDLPTMMHFLRTAGYRNVVSGKTHFIGADQLHGFDKRLTTDIYPSGFDWSIDWTPPVTERAGTSVKKLEVSGLCKTNNQILYDTEVQYRAIEFLRYEALEPKPESFFLHVSYTQPHEAYQTLPKYWDLYEGVDIEMPRLPEDENPHPVTNWLKLHHGIDKYPPSEQTIRDSRRAYFAMITHIDEFIGEMVAELKHLGLYDDTVIVFTSDHGDMMGERNMWFKRTFYDPSLKVPLIVHAPAAFRPRRVSENVSLIDLCATIADMGGAADAYEQFGCTDSRSFAPMLTGAMDGWPDEIIVEYFGPGVEEPWLCIKRGSHKYVYTRNHPAQLFNVHDDPDELDDLIGEPSKRALVESLHKALFGGLDLEAVTAKAKQSKKTRVFLHETLKGSEGYNWSYQPLFDAKQQYVRGPNTPSSV